MKLQDASKGVKAITLKPKSCSAQYSLFQQGDTGNLRQHLHGCHGSAKWSLSVHLSNLAGETGRDGSWPCRLASHWSPTPARRRHERQEWEWRLTEIKNYVVEKGKWWWTHSLRVSLRLCQENVQTHLQKHKLWFQNLMSKLYTSYFSTLLST